MFNEIGHNFLVSRNIVKHKMYKLEYTFILPHIECVSAELTVVLRNTK